MGLLDGLFSGGSGGGLLDFLRNNALNQQFGSGLQSDQAQYGQQPLASQPMQAMAQMPQQQALAQPPAALPMQQAPAQQPIQQQPMSMGGPQPPSSGGLGAGLNGFINNLHTGPIGALIGGIGSAAGLEDPRLQAQRLQANQTARFLKANGVPDEAILAAVGSGRVPGNPKVMEALLQNYVKDKNPVSIGEGYVFNPETRKYERAYTPDKTPTSVQEFEYGQSHPGFREAQLEKTRAGAAVLNNQNNIDMNSGQTYDKQLAEGLGKSHAALANGVEDAQTRARDISAMQAAVDAIQKNGGTTGGLAPAQRLELQKSINAGAASLGIEKPFSESDLSDKEFLTKFNRSMAGAQAKGAVGSRVTNFEMSNFLKANPGLDMTITGNQRLLGIQAQIEQRNIAVGNSIRDATAAAIRDGKKIDPVTVQKILSDYDEAHHVKDPITGQDLTQSYTLPEFQNASPTNKSMSDQHEQSIQRMEKKVGDKTYYKGPDGNWYVK